MKCKEGRAHTQDLPGWAADSSVVARSTALVICTVGAVLRFKTETSHSSALSAKQARNYSNESKAHDRVK